MTMGEYIRLYTHEHNMSYRKFAKICDVSSGYISMLVNGKNPKTGKPITPDIETYIKFANGMGITLDELFRVIEDSPVRIAPASKIKQSSGAPKTPEARIVSGGMDKLPKEQREQILGVVRAMFANNPGLFKEEG